MAIFRVAGTSPTFSERVFAKIEITMGCWWWTGALDEHGYGVIGKGPRGAGNMPAHVAVWELLVGLVPPTMTFDHLCRNHQCVSPEHGEIVTATENKRRGYSPAAQWARREACLHGHQKDGWTTTKKSGRVRYCKTCARINMAKRRMRGVA